MRNLWRKGVNYYKNLLNRHGKKNLGVFVISCFILILGLGLIWVSTLKVPALDTIETRKVSQSTKIYDSTGKILLYDVFRDTKRQIVPFENISKNIKDATMS